MNSEAMLSTLRTELIYPRGINEPQRFIGALDPLTHALVFNYSLATVGRDVIVLAGTTDGDGDCAAKRARGGRLNALILSIQRSAKTSTLRLQVIRYRALWDVRVPTK